MIVPPKRLLVEGNDDMHAIAQLMGHFTPWPTKPPPVIGVQCNGDELLHGARIAAEIKSYDIVGIVIDADENPTGRWTTIRNKLLPFFENFPENPLPDGVILSNAQGKKIGVWIMPDNLQAGMLETFLRWLVPPAAEQLWQHAVASTDASRAHGADYTDAHRDKAYIHTWLAWVDPPGQSFGHALRSRILDPNAQQAVGFVAWFMALYELAPLP